MCTLTVVPTAGGVRLAFNRDEQRTRPAALPPVAKRFGRRTAILPTDPASGGTWVAVNDAGLALALLNANPVHRADRPKPPRSRGEIIPHLAAADSPAAALALADGLRLPEYAPFRLALVGQGVVAVVRWDGRERMVTSTLLGGPRMLTSSGLGDHLVEGVRRELFGDLLGGPPESWPAAQAAFHRHRWPGREHLSVNMCRADARTCSVTTIDLTASDVALAYHPDAPDVPADATTVRLPRAGGVP